MTRALVAAGCLLAFMAVLASCGSSHALSAGDARAILTAWHAKNYYFNHFQVVPGTTPCNMDVSAAVPEQRPGRCTTTVTDTAAGVRTVSFLEHWNAPSGGSALTGGWTVTVDARGRVRGIAVTGSKPPELGSP